MELKVNEVSIPDQITFNYEELKKELIEKVETYEMMVYTDDQIKEAKADKANLNKLKKALNDERIRREKEYMKPFNGFKAQVNEIIAIIDKPIAVIDKQVKEYEEKQKQEKSEQIYEYIQGCGFYAWDVDPALIFNQKWLNATYSMKQIQTEIDERMKQIDSEMSVIDSLEDFKFEAELKYKQTLSLTAAMEEVNRLKKIKAMKEEAEKTVPTVDIPTEQPEEKPGQWIKFKAFLTVAQAAELKEFFKRRNIDFQAI